jgi:tRNA pseudouridine38-40 synthase
VGWQRQKDGRSVQAELERALTKVANEAISVVTAGRTDAGVHARMQVAHFESAASRGALNWVLGANRHLPADIALHWAQAVPPAFHARFSALARCYRYRIHESRIRPVLERERCAWVTQRLDLEAMRQGAAWLVGEHDFSAFRAAGCQAKSPWREIKRIELWREAHALHLEVEANAFLQHMVRNLAGSLVWVGKGRNQPDWMRDVLAGQDRRHAGPAAPARGLTLIGVRYPSHFDIPSSSIGCAHDPNVNPSSGKYLR